MSGHLTIGLSAQERIEKRLSELRLTLAAGPRLAETTVRPQGAGARLRKVASKAKK